MVRHRWVAIALFELSDCEARRSCEEEQVVELTRGNLTGVVGPVCFECEAEYSKTSGECPGPRIEGSVAHMGTWGRGAHYPS